MEARKGFRVTGLYVHARTSYHSRGRLCYTALLGQTDPSIS
jgi:hypothetical protein